MKNLKRAFATNALLTSAACLLFSGCFALAQDQSDQTSEVVYAVGNGVTAPKPVYMPNPEYTDSARKKKINGSVTLGMIVTAEGNVRDLKVIKSLDKGLDKQALAAVSTWRFEPATKDGKPVAVHLSTDVTFRLY
jgi:periplasmic protein TonB